MLHIAIFCHIFYEIVTNCHMLSQIVMFFRECRLGAGNSWRSGVMCIDCTSSPPSLSAQTNEHTQTHPLHIDGGKKYKQIQIQIQL